MNMKIEKWQVENGIAKPVNPFSEFVPSGAYVNSNWQEFNAGIKDHTFATNAPSGIHSAEMFGEVEWQFKHIHDTEWMIGKKSKFHSFENFKNGLILMNCEKNVSFESRQFLPFKHPVEPNEDHENDAIWKKLEETEWVKPMAYNPKDTQPLNPNANAIKVVSERINYYGNKGATSKAGENKDFAIWNELQHILKLLQ